MESAARHRRVAADLLRQKSLAALLDALAAGGVDVLVIKGAALALLVYDQPEERDRCDADLLISRRQLEAAERILAALGYRRQLEPDAQVATGQRHYSAPASSADVIDLHWRAANPLAFSAVLDFDVVWPRRIPIPALGPRAATLSIPDALLLACVHRVAHHRDVVEPRWLADIDRLVRRLDGEEGRLFVSEARRTATRQVCERGLTLAHARYGTPIDALRSDFSAVPSVAEPSSAFIGGHHALADELLSDLRMAGWGTRAALLKEHLFPPLDYLRMRYPQWPAPLLPLAYAYRIAHGAPAWLRRRTPG
jgi:hypothetical protein